MKNYFALSLTLFISAAAFAQQNSGEGIRRDSLHAHDIAVMPTPDQVSYVTPPDLLRASGPVRMPTAAEINTVTPPALPRASGKAVQPAPSQISNDTPPELLKTTIKNSAGVKPASGTTGTTGQ